MRTYIKQCKFCTNEPGCKYKKEIKSLLKSISGPTAKIICDRYPKLFRLQRPVEVEVFTLEEKELETRYKDTFIGYKWCSLGYHKGKIWSVKDKLWYTIQLNTPIEVCRKINGKLETILLEFTKKPANKLRFPGTKTINLRRE